MTDIGLRLKNDLDLHCKLEDYQAMLQTKFQTSEASGSEEEDFWIFYTYFYDSNLGLSGAGPFCTPPFEYIWQKTTRQCYILNFKIWAKWFWRRRFWIFFYIFYGLNLGPPCLGPSWTLWPSFEETSQRTTRQCYIPNFKHLSQAVLKKKIF